MASACSTPAMNQSVPDWAHPTPSPSLMVRYPDPSSWSAPNFGSTIMGKQEAAAPPSNSGFQELLLQVCTPFFKDMMSAVEQVVQQEVEARVKNLTSQDVGVAPAWPSKRRSQEKIQPPFGDEPQLMKKRNSITSEPLREESSEDENEEDGSGQGHFSALFGGHPPPSKSRPSSGGSWHGDSDEEPDSPAPCFEARASSDGSHPVYLQWSSQGQSSGERPSLTPTVSPVVPNLHPFTSTGPVAQQSHQQPAAASSSPRPPSEQKESSQPAAAKCAVVCRHWKSKGWCRMGDECKFAHPEHKCGTGATQAKKDRQNGANGQMQTKAGQSAPQMAAQEAKAKVKTPKSRKATGASEAELYAQAVPGVPFLTPGLVHNAGQHA